MAVIDQNWRDLTEASASEREMIYKRLIELYGAGFVNHLRNRFEADQTLAGNEASIHSSSTPEKK